MTLKKWGYLFWTTLLVGTAVGMIAGIALKLTVPNFVFLGVEVGWYEWLFMLFGAGMIAVLSQMGFFAYLTVRFVALNLFRGKLLYWDILQVILIIVALFDIVYLRYTGAANDGNGSWVQYILLPIVILLVSIAVTYRKVKETNRRALIPTLFFMSVATILEAVPAFNLNEATYTTIMVAPLLACNAWQILLLHRLLPANNNPKSG
ncbi:KinB-signaling pathway activation protein [Paenibacillus flagellatus]|uniref:KinB signaling pathway activation protein n=1 Tax=Paenibacillus flagellatus TaxID=2211139 RepID=A0A2V5JVG9_9BACL|nr:KinB-signaling pathway activation protein [Paenibacillus flagellatus]PYI50102.1 KinB signaling pathway activation protein [Paenibacillus flagellatus]